jgi:ABC-type transport system substrate-binding protein
MIAAAAAAATGCSESPAQWRPKDAGPSARSGGVLRLFSEAPASLDPSDVASVYDSLPVNQIFDGLVTINPSLNVVPALAETWTISRDGLVYTFQLRSGVRFHDGSPLTAEDVVFTFRHALDPRRERPSSVGPYLASLRGAADFAAGRRADLPGVQAIDDRTVRIELDQPRPTFLEVLAVDFLRVIPRAAFSRMGAARFRREPIGTGPFRFKAWNERRVELEANPDHFNGPPKLSEVTITFPAEGERDLGAARFERGEIDAFEPNAEILEKLARRNDVAVFRFHELNLSFLGLGTGHPPFDDPLVRQAVAHAIDREGIAALSPTARRPAQGILPPGLPAYSPQPKALPYDPARARALLAQAGHPGGRGLPRVRIYTSVGTARSRETDRRIAGNLETVGFSVEIVEVGWAEMSRRTEDHDAQAFLLGWVADIPDPDAFLATLFEPETSSNYFSFRDDAVATMLRSGARETHPVSRARVYRDVERRILELAPVVPLYHTVGALACRRGAHGLEPGPLGLASLDLENVWIEEAGGWR